MKKLILFCILLINVFMFVGCDNKEDIVRIHIRANSNLDCDQTVKLKVRDEVIEYITPLIADCYNSNDVKIVLQKNLSSIEDIADNVLLSNGFEYSSNAKINNEYFPSRMYGESVFESGYYDALILNLGSGTGDNWWCVAYPPLCFVGEETSGQVKYKSKLVELINKYFGE